MSALSAFVTELRERRLWPVAVVLLIGIVAVPLVLAKTPPPSPAPVASASGLPVSSNPTGPAVSLGATPTATPPRGSARNPFTPPPGTGSQAAASPAGTSSSPATPASASKNQSSATSKSASSANSGSSGGTGTGSGGATGTGSGGATGTGSGGATGSGSGTTPSTAAPAPASTGSKPGPPRLSATQAYDVGLAISTPGSGLDTIDSLERLSILPNRQEPLLVELGVAQGGRSVLFAVQPGAAITGPGRCAPGPIDCQVLSLAPGQSESLAASNGTVSNLLFAVTAIKANKYRSRADAARARRMTSVAGHRFLSSSTLSALTLFKYDPSLGAVVDLRNLRVGNR